MEEERRPPPFVILNGERGIVGRLGQTPQFGGHLAETPTRPKFGRRRSGALQYQAGGTRFVVSQISGATLQIGLQSQR
jgi:hypothetical protein